MYVIDLTQIYWLKFAAIDIMWFAEVSVLILVLLTLPAGILN